MKKLRHLLCAAVAIVLFGLPFSARSQQHASGSPQDQERLRHQFAVGLLRIINTAEVEPKAKQGSYVSWDVLRTTTDFSQYLTRSASQIGLQLNSRPGPAPEILSGWSLRLDVTADGKGYDLLLEDLTDKSCGYAAVTDERGVIRQSKAIDCEI